MVLGLVQLIDAKGNDVAQPIWPRGCLTEAQKQAKNAFFVLLGHFWAFVGQPHGHISWATSMPFLSINPTNPRTNPWNFHEKILRIGDFEKFFFFESAILIFFFKFFFRFIPLKTSQSLLVSKDGSKFWSSQMWQHFLTHAKHFEGECIPKQFFSLKKKFSESILDLTRIS